MSNQSDSSFQNFINEIIKRLEALKSRVDRMDARQTSLIALADTDPVNNYNGQLWVLKASGPTYTLRGYDAATSSKFSIVGGSGTGIPPGGDGGQVLTKIDSTDYNVDWEDTPVYINRDGSTLNGHIAVWHNNDSDSIEDGGPMYSGGPGIYIQTSHAVELSGNTILLYRSDHGYLFEFARTRAGLDAAIVFAQAESNCIILIPSGTINL